MSFSLLDAGSRLYHLTAATSAAPKAVNELLGKEIPLTLAGLSGAVGAVVVVFVLFGLQSLDREGLDEAMAAEPLPRKREIAALRLLLSTSSTAMLTLLLTPLFLVYNLVTQALAPSRAVAIGLGSFSFSVSILIVGLFAYFVVSAIRLRRLEDIARDVNLSPVRTSRGTTSMDAEAT